MYLPTEEDPDTEVETSCKKLVSVFSELSSVKVSNTLSAQVSNTLSIQVSSTLYTGFEYIISTGFEYMIYTGFKNIIYTGLEHIIYTCFVYIPSPNPTRGHPISITLDLLHRFPLPPRMHKHQYCHHILLLNYC